MKVLSTLLMQLVLTQTPTTDTAKPLGLFDEPGLTWKQTAHGLQASRAETGLNQRVKTIHHQTLTDNFKRIDLHHEKEKSGKEKTKLEKQKDKERKRARKSDKKKHGKPEKVDKNKILIARPSVNREAPPPHPHQWLNAYFRSGSENSGRLAERRELLRSARRENSKRKVFKTCDGLPRPEIKCDNCEPGFPYYDCSHRDKNKGTFKCKIECSKGRKVVSTVHKIKCRQSGWKQLYPSVIQCVPRGD